MPAQDWLTDEALSEDKTLLHFPNEDSEVQRGYKLTTFPQLLSGAAGVNLHILT